VYSILKIVNKKSNVDCVETKMLSSDS